MAEIQGFQAQGKIICSLCDMPRDRGGYIVKSGPAPGAYCSAEHARRAVEKKQEEEGEK